MPKDRLSSRLATLIEKLDATANRVVEEMQHQSHPENPPRQPVRDSERKANE